MQEHKAGKGKKTLSLIIYITIGFLILFIAFVLRFYHLNYNSPFSDEATYIVIGRLGIFQGDWWTYNASAWLAGFPYIYPPMTAIASMTGGILGSRFLNVILGVLTVEAIFLLTKEVSGLKNYYGYIAGFIAASLVAGSTIALYVSRLATYDAPSYYFFLLSLIPLLQAEQPRRNSGRLYFYASIILLLSCLTKIIIFVYLPFIIVYSFYKARKRGKEQLHFWKIYFLFPMLLILTIYFLGNFTMLKTYAAENILRDKTPIPVFFQTMWEDSKFIWPFWMIGSIGLFIKRKFVLWGILTYCAFLIMFPHLITQRALWTFEKQVTVTVCFLSIIAGIGIAELTQYIKNTSELSLLLLVLSGGIFFYISLSFQDFYRFNVLWNNSTAALSYLSKNVYSGEKILAESGGTAILATYDKNFPTNTTTFDWFVYRKQTGEKAYLNAVKDGYFDIIELEGTDQQDNAIFSKLHNKVYAYLTGDYKKVYSRNGFVIYKRAY